MKPLSKLMKSTDCMVYLLESSTVVFQLRHFFSQSGAILGQYTFSPRMCTA